MGNKTPSRSNSDRLKNIHTKTIYKQEHPQSWCFKKQVTYRIPALIYISDNQTFLAFAEKRKMADDTDADVLVMRKGIWKDEGVEWNSGYKLLTLACQPNCRSMNPCPVYERKSKTLFLFFITVPVGVSDKNENQAQLCYITSKDTGTTWSHITDLTADVIGEQVKDWATFAVGPGHGVQMKSGRLIIPAYVYPCHPLNCKPTAHAFAFYSDYKGSTWHVGKRMGFLWWPDEPLLILHDGPSAYSDLVEFESGQFACLFECGKEHENEEIAFLHFKQPK